MRRPLFEEPDQGLSVALGEIHASDNCAIGRINKIATNEG
jgi:hypothetical protein